MSPKDDAVRYLELADRFDQLAANAREGSLRQQYGRMATQLRQLAGDHILAQKE